MKDMMMAKMMTMLSSMLPIPEAPENPVAQFVSYEIRKLYPEENEIMTAIEGAVIDMANRDQEGAMRVLLTLYNDIGNFYEVITSEVGDGTAEEQ